MCVRFLARFVAVFFFLLSFLQTLSAAAPGDLISIDMWTAVQQSSVFSNEPPQAICISLAYSRVPRSQHLELWDNLLPAYADGTLAGLTW